MGRNDAEGESASARSLGNTACPRAGKTWTAQQWLGVSCEVTFSGQCFSVQCKLVNI